MNEYEKLKKALKLEYNPVGVKLIFKNTNKDKFLDKFQEVDDLERYCEYVKRAAKGEFIKLKRGDFSCVTGEIILGLKEPQTIKFDNRLNFRDLESILLFPVNIYNSIAIDSIILIVTPRNGMDITEAYTKLYKKPLKIELGTQSGVCSDITALVIKRQDINFSFLCVGSRIYAGFEDRELLCGIPYNMANELINIIIEITTEREADIELVKQLKNGKNL